MCITVNGTGISGKAFTLFNKKLFYLLFLIGNYYSKWQVKMLFNKPVVIGTVTSDNKFLTLSLNCLLKKNFCFFFSGWSLKINT